MRRYRIALALVAALGANDLAAQIPSSPPQPHLVPARQTEWLIATSNCGIPTCPRGGSPEGVAAAYGPLVNQACPSNPPVQFSGTCTGSLDGGNYWDPGTVEAQAYVTFCKVFIIADGGKVYSSVADSSSNLRCRMIYSDTGTTAFRSPPGVRFYCPSGYRAAYVGGRQVWCQSEPTAPPIDADKSAGACRANSGSTRVGNPCDVATGNKYQMEVDYSAGAAMSGGSTLARYYNSANTPVLSGFGWRWRHTYERSIDWRATNFLYAVRPDGRTLIFRLTGNSWSADADVSDKLEQVYDGGGNPSGWVYRAAEGDIEETYAATGKLLAIKNRVGQPQTLEYSDGTTGPNGGFVLDANGQPTSTPLPEGLLIRVRDPYGRVIAFGYDAMSRIVRAVLPGQEVLAYTYDSESNLTQVSYPDSATRDYYYNEQQNTGGASLPHALTGISDSGVPFATYKYDAQGRAISSEHAGGVGKYQIAYDTPYDQRTVTDPLGTGRIYTFQSVLRVAKNTAITGAACPGCGPASTTLDANGNVASQTDWNGHVTTYQYDLARNLETSRTEASGSPQARTITTGWHPTYRLPTRIVEPGRETTMSYDTVGNMLTRSVRDTATNETRTWTYTYNANGQVLTVDGPRTNVSDVTTYTYYADNDPDLGKRGNLATVTSAAGHMTQILAYNAHGQPTQIVDPNGLTTTLTYDARQRLTSRAVGSETTAYTYDGVGQLTRVTLPDGSAVDYSYDAAHRLTQIQDSTGNKIVYTLDAIGNRTREDTFDPGGALVRTLSRVYDSLNRLSQYIGAQ